MKSKSWENVKDWYDHLVGEEGHYYHQNLIIPHILDTIKKYSPKSLLDVACGQGILSRKLGKGIHYTGVDLAKSLVNSAKQRNKFNSHSFLVGDARELDALDMKPSDFATFILAAQDIDDFEAVMKGISNKLNDGGHCLIVLNHPCFRIPRQSSWCRDEQRKLQSRLLNSYMSTLDIPIQTNPGQGHQSMQTKHYHRPLSTYFNAFNKTGFVVENCEELCSDKKSTGKYRKMEDRARQEFPLFLSFTLKKL